MAGNLDNAKQLGKGIYNATQLDAQNYAENGIINGGFDFWDYGTSQTTSGYGSDNRWVNLHGILTKTHSLQISGATEKDLFESKYFSRTEVTSVSSATEFCYKIQKIERVSSYSNKKATVSFWAKADANKNIALEFYQDFGTGGTPSAQVTGIGSQLVSLSTSWQHFKMTVDIPSVVGKTLGTDNNDFIFVGFWFSSGSDYSARNASLPMQSGTFDIAEVRIDEGEIARPFGRVDLAMERFRMTRFIQLLYLHTSTSVVQPPASVSVPAMRGNPSITTTPNAGTGASFLAGGNTEKSSMSVWQDVANSQNTHSKVLLQAEL